jgi:hypothetical protein
MRCRLLESPSGPKETEKSVTGIPDTFAERQSPCTTLSVRPHSPSLRKSLKSASVRLDERFSEANTQNRRSEAWEHARQ